MHFSSGGNSFGCAGYPEGTRCLGCKRWDANRSVFALEAKENLAFLPLSQATIAIVQGTNKLTYYHDYSRYKDVFEFYDWQNHIAKKKDRFATGGKMALDMKDELLDLLTAANKSFENNTTSKE